MPNRMNAFVNRGRKWLWRVANPQRGFTLLELILSIAILSAVLVTIYATLSMGSRTWEKGERDIEKVQRMRVVMDLLSRQIKAAYPYKVTPGELDTHKEFFAFDGKEDYLSFVSCIPLYGGTGRLSWLTFWVEEGAGLVVVERDALRSDILKEREAMDKDEMMVLDANVTNIRFAYYRAEGGDREEAADEETDWEEKWDAEEEGSLPQAVSVAVTFREEATAQGDEDEVYTRELVIPLMIAAADRSSGGRDMRAAAPESVFEEETGMVREDDATGGSFAEAESGKRGVKSGERRGPRNWGKKGSLSDRKQSGGQFK